MATEEKKKAPAANQTVHHSPAEQNQQYDADIMTYLSWHAPGRPFKHHTKEYFFNASLIMFALEIILFLFSQYLLMLVVFALVFLSFALAAIPPRTFFYKITSEGILIEDHFFIWEELYDFYFLPQHGVEILHIGTRTYYPGEILLTLGTIPKEQVKSLLIRFLPYREYVKPTFTDRAGIWLQQTFPLEKAT